MINSSVNSTGNIEKLKKIVQSLELSKGVGANTNHKLYKQQENMNANIDNIDIELKQSQKMITSINSFWNQVKNKFESFPYTTLDQEIRNSNQQNIITPEFQLIKQKKKEDPRQVLTQQLKQENMFDELNKENNLLDIIREQVKQLKGLAKITNLTLDKQNHLIQKINKKTQKNAKKMGMVMKIMNKTSNRYNSSECL